VTAESLANRAGVAVQLGRHDEADTMLERAAAIVLAVHGEAHPERIHILLVGAELAEARGDLERAERLARDAHARALNLEGEHTFSRDAESRLLHTLLTTGQHDEALDVASAALDRRLDLHEPDHELVGEAWVNLAWARLESGDDPGARSALDEAFRCGWAAGDIVQPAELAAMARKIGNES
jgi:tetratricopeptide (TPR) repeat protein